MLFPVVIVHIAVTFIGFVDPGLLLSRPGEQQSSGITGTVYRLAGNHMPAPNRPSHPSADTGAHPPAGVKATVCIFQLTSDTQVIRQGQSSPYYRAVLTRLIQLADRLLMSAPQRITCKNLQGSSPAFLISAVFQHETTSQLNHLVVCEDAEAAAYLHNTIESLTGALDLFYFPSSFKNKKNSRLLNSSHV